ncbi:hypothetical protein VP01_4636g1 [Puccinia sorghi]|uniref:Uncharacterized protein n=1 Tax=Puccinia sorghi TaxID=27349 RepID=A0A0L6UND4_9BASI|nr:hypothetical protein VP01_4636g1 [Puccinia sorghi]
MILLHTFVIYPPVSNLQPQSQQIDNRAGQRWSRHIVSQTTSAHKNRSSIGIYPSSWNIKLCRLCRLCLRGQNVSGFYFFQIPSSSMDCLPWHSEHPTLIISLNYTTFSLPLELVVVSFVYFASICLWGKDQIASKPKVISELSGTYILETHDYPIGMWSVIETFEAWKCSHISLPFGVVRKARYRSFKFFVGMVQKKAQKITNEKLTFLYPHIVKGRCWGRKMKQNWWGRNLKRKFQNLVQIRWRSQSLMFCIKIICFSNYIYLMGVNYPHEPFLEKEIVAWPNIIKNMNLKRIMLCKIIKGWINFNITFCNPRGCDGEKRVMGGINLSVSLRKEVANNLVNY